MDLKTKADRDWGIAYAEVCWRQQKVIDAQYALWCQAPHDAPFGETTREAPGRRLNEIWHFFEADVRLELCAQKLLRWRLRGDVVTRRGRLASASERVTARQKAKKMERSQRAPADHRGEKVGTNPHEVAASRDEKVGTEPLEMEVLHDEKVGTKPMASDASSPSASAAGGSVHQPTRGQGWDDPSTDAGESTRDAYGAAADSAATPWAFSDDPFARSWIGP